jgi:nucleoside-diphosphate-sugar epimerase
MKIFVTGGTGFIGQHLIKALINEKKEVFALVRDKEKAKNLEKIGASIILGDLNSVDFLKKALKNIDIVYHLAAFRGEWYKGKQLEWEDFYQNNVLTTENLLKASFGQIKRFVFISSVFVLGCPQKLPADESFPLKPETFYAKSKSSGEKMTLMWSKKGLPATIIRPAMVYGPGDNYGMILKLARLIKRGIFPNIGWGKNYLHLVYIDDLVEGLMKVGGEKPLSSIYILAGEKPIAVNQLVNLIAQSLSVNITTFYLPVWLAKLACFLMERVCFWGEPFMTRHKVDLLTKDQIYSIEKAKRELGYEPKIGYQQGIEKTIQWYQENGYL